MHAVRLHDADYAFLASLRVAGEVAEADGIMFAIEGLAAVAGRAADYLRAAGLAGLAGALRASNKLILSPNVRKVNEETIRLIQGNLDEGMVAAAFEAAESIAAADPAGWATSRIGAHHPSGRPTAARG